MDHDLGSRIALLLNMHLIDFKADIVLKIHNILFMKFSIFP